MSRKRKAYSREFKEEALKRVDESGKPLTQVARELGIRADLLYSWKRRRLAASGAEERSPVMVSVRGRRKRFDGCAAS